MITTIPNGSLATSSRSAQAYAPSLWRRLLYWADEQQENRLVWMGVALTGHASFLTPFTVMAVMLLGNHFGLFMAAMVAMGIALVTNLAALPTRITIPAFLLSIVMDIAIVLAAFALA